MAFGRAQTPISNPLRQGGDGKLTLLICLEWRMHFNARMCEFESKAYLRPADWRAPSILHRTRQGYGGLEGQIDIGCLYGKSLNCGKVLFKIASHDAIRQNDRAIVNHGHFLWRDDVIMPLFVSDGFVVIVIII